MLLGGQLVQGAGASGEICRCLNHPRCLPRLRQPPVESLAARTTSPLEAPSHGGETKWIHERYPLRPRNANNGSATKNQTMNGNPTSEQRGFTAARSLAVNHTTRPLAADLAAVMLTDKEEEALARCEAVIRRGWESFVEVGVALAQIREQQLYRDQYKTFEDYCREKWAYGRQYAYRLIAAAEVVKCLSPIGDIPQPTHESQVRPLFGLEPEKVREVWKKAVAKAGDGNVKATVVQEVAAEFQSKKRPRKAKMRYTPSPVGLTVALKYVAELDAAIRANKGTEILLRCLGRVRSELTRLKGV